MTPVDIIIPVYRGAAETRACIESVLAARNTQSAEIVVINDASPEAEIRSYLAELAADVSITLVNNESNLGFVATCNQAMQMHSERDVVLLNSDTVVTDGWLDRMVACAAAVPNAASVTPFSNNATLCSYPRIAASNELPAAMSLSELDAMFAKVNADLHVEIPTGVGFCMLMTRAAVDTIGIFDVEAFGRGYGEENDWCMRATAQGFTHLLCGDVFVYHKGEVSFGADTSTGKQVAQAVIDARYPGYRALISLHLAADPARALRRRVDMARLASSARPRVLFITHNWGGGTDRHVNDLAESLSESLEVLVFKPHDEQSLSLRWLRKGEEFEAYFEDRSDPQELLQVLRAIGISRIHLHHVHGLPAYVLDLHNALDVPLDITLHDYFPVTQRYHLGLGGKLESAGPAPANDWALSDIEWQQRMGALLGAAQRVIAPSHDLARRTRQYFPDVEIQVHAHPDVVSGPVMKPRKILVLGGLTIEKGLKLLEACAIDAQARKLPLFFKLIGHTADKVATFPELPLAISGTYRESDLDQLIALEKGDAFLFPAQIPESYSYTLTSALRTNLPIVASALGSFTERLEGHPDARTLPWDSAPHAWNDALLAATDTGVRRTDDRGHMAGVDAKPAQQAYARWYLAPIRAAKPANVIAADFSPRIWYASEIRGPRREYSLQQLFDIGVDCGHAPSLAELRRRTVIADQQIAHMHRQVHEGQRHIETLDREIIALHANFAVMQERLEFERQAARETYEEVILSSSWRITEPLRSATIWARDKRARLAEFVRAVRRLPRSLAIARQILAAEGFKALVWRMRTQLSLRAMPPPAVTTVYSVERKIVPMTIETSDKPKYSLIIPVYDQHLLTFTCLKSIAETCKGLAIEVLVIDDCSPQPAAEALSSVAGITVLRNETNLGFLASCNHGVTHAKGEFVAILNNDLILTAGWLQEMEAVFRQLPDCGLVGAKLVYPDGRLQEAGGIVWRDGSAWNVGRGDDPGKPEYNFVREVDYCSGACLLIERDFWNALGGFDTAYAPAYYEDTDLAFRVREAGRRVYYQPHAVVVHFEGQSSGTDLTKGVKRHQLIHQKTFERRWTKVLASHRPNGMWPHLEQNRYSSTRILVIDACMLTPDQDSGSLRMFEMLSLMRNLGHKVTFVATNLEYRQPYVAAIQAIGVEVLHNPYVTSIVRHLEQHGASYDVVVLSRETTASQYFEVVKRHVSQAKVIFDTVDLHFLRTERQAALTNDEPLRLAARKMRESELGFITAADATLVVSPIEQDILRQLAPRANVQIVSNIHVPMPGPEPYAARDGILFIGGFRHPPNLDAITWYIEKVLPILRIKHPGLVTTVIGSNAPPWLERYAAQDLVIAGFVPDVTAHYHAARLSISPLRYGAGVKGKINLAMQYGVPVVATTVSVEGMYLKDEESVLVADEPEAFADAIIRLHGDDALWTRLRQGGLDNIEEWFSRSAARRALESVLGK